ncbi:MAG: hypothetical protein WC148_03470 [Bacilli bacterium]
MSNFGMLGAIAGVGQGMQSYAEVMQKNKEAAWEDMRSQVNYERQLHLQELNDQRARALAKDNYAHAETLQKQGFTNSETLQKQGFANSQKLYGIELADKRADQIEQNRFTAGENAANRRGALDLLNRQNTLNQQNRKDAATFTTAQELKENTAEWEALKKSGILEGKTDKEKEFIELATLHPKVAATVATLTKKDADKFSPEQYAITYRKSLEDFPTLDANRKEAIKQKAMTNGYDPLDADSFYAQQQAAIASRLSSGATKEVAKPLNAKGWAFFEHEVHADRITPELMKVLKTDNDRARAIKIIEAYEASKNASPEVESPSKVEPAVTQANPDQAPLTYHGRTLLGPRKNGPLDNAIRGQLHDFGRLLKGNYKTEENQ